MRDYRQAAAKAARIVAIFTALPSAAAQGDDLKATVDKPAVVTAAPAKAAGTEAAGQRPRIVFDVTGYQPPGVGSVRARVSAQRPDGTEQYIGTFGVTGEFKRQSPSVPLPADLASGAPLKLKVELVPAQGGATGKGAQLDLGGAEIR